MPGNEYAKSDHVLKKIPKARTGVFMQLAWARLIVHYERIGI
ncbi:hypothetical protein LDG_7975 [Legionella drancourtii LLAP12]|uniref:Uncharacterized protein n=1 Tax=Legionella drancourtii LLAP12 TaxID=658187 RepID=G9ERQ7_9GAMM|nr:hypothetical protein LDG_7975 [Legionella drancourtii LLAP12]